jgi:glycosyltransferase involved in cell wall biosynthesis
MGAGAKATGRFDRRISAIRARFLNRERALYLGTQLKTLELFSDDRCASPRLLDGLISGDVINLHWIANLEGTQGFLDYRRFFAALPIGAPLVWTLHDMNPFTGGCHYSLGCDKFISRCGACPQLGSSWADDLSYRVLARKRDALARVGAETTCIVAPSTWMCREARRSALFARFDVRTIPYGLDTLLYQPLDKAVCRKILNIPIDLPSLLFMSDSLSNHRKGMDVLVAAIKQIPNDQRPLVISIGAGGGVETAGLLHLPLGRIDDERLMATAYNAADIFVTPTRADNLPNGVLEAMACGIPVVGPKVGGVPDMIVDGETGVLFDSADARAMAQAMNFLLGSHAKRIEMGLSARARAVQEYDLVIQAHRYRMLYESLIERSRKGG